MSYVVFSDCGYECFGPGRNVLFSENNTHEFLFNYVTQDLSCLPKLFDQYISQRMDTSTCELRDYLGNNTTLDQMKSLLAAVHPYYKHEFKEVLIRAIGTYFNSLLLYLRYSQKIDLPDSSKEWYIDRIKALMKPLLEVGDTYPTDFYNEYQKHIGEDLYPGDLPKDEWETLVPGVSRKPTGLINEIQAQREAYNMLYFLLDISAEGLEKLTTSQRVWLYSNITAVGRDGIMVRKKLSLKHQVLYQSGNDYDPATEYGRELNEKFNQLKHINHLDQLNVGRDGVPEEMNEVFCSVIDYAKTVTTSKLFYDEYEVDSLYEILYLEILSMVQGKVMIRKCRRCGKYFVVTNRKNFYCSRGNEFGLSCSDVGPRDAYNKKLEEDEALKIYSRAYKTHFARKKKGTMSEKEFREWYERAKAKLVATRAGELDIASFQEWLKK